MLFLKNTNTTGFADIALNYCLADDRTVTGDWNGDGVDTVTWGSKLGGTEGIARIMGEALEGEGFDVDLKRTSELRDASAYEAAIIGGTLYANRWHRDARRFVTRNVAALRRMPVWLFSSGPLDDSADQRDIAPTTQVAVLMERIGALGHVTFGGRLPADAKGFPAAAMAKKLSGDWRNPDRIRAWAADIARVLTRFPRTVIVPSPTEPRLDPPRRTGKAPPCRLDRLA
jgi:menaquinone-dependent protoporphyrinogen oxidase